MRRLRGVFTWAISSAMVGAFLGRLMGIVPQTYLDQIGVLALGWIIFRLTESAGPGTSVLVGLLVAGALQWLWMVTPDMVLMPYILIVSSNLFVAWVFARGMLPGREPILLRLIRLMDRHPLDDPRFCRFIRGQCWLWAGLSVITAAVSFAAMFVAGSAPLIVDALLLLALGQICWFMLSHRYASARYGRPETWWWSVRTMVWPEFWTRLTTP